MDRVLPALLLLAGAPAVLAVCDTCLVRNKFTKDFSTPFESQVTNFPVCQQYKDAACCSQETVQNIAEGYTIYNTAELQLQVDACYDDPAIAALAGNFSDACMNFFINEYCFYECDPNVGRYRQDPKCSEPPPFGWDLLKMPIRGDYCDEWFDACQDDFFCIDAEGGNIDFYAHAKLNAAKKCTQASGNCKKFKDIYGASALQVQGGGVGFCDYLWPQSFKYDPEDRGFTMDFPPDGPNPNDDVHPESVPVSQSTCPFQNYTDAAKNEACGDNAERFQLPEIHPCEVCQLRNDHTEDVARPRPDLVGACSKYKDNACCNNDTASRIDLNYEYKNMQYLYGEDFRWDRCYLHHENLVEDLIANNTKRLKFERCAQWFEEQECFYECDVNAGKWRAEEDCTTEDGRMAAREIKNMPIRASECDKFYDDCFDTVLCACSGPDCEDQMKPKNLYGTAVVPNACKKVDDKPSPYCSKTVGQLFTSGKDFCNTLWGVGTFVYEEHEKAAYTIAWNSELDPYQITYDQNPNNEVRPDVAFPPNCPSFDATVDLCTANGTIVPAGSGDSSTTEVVSGQPLTESPEGVEGEGSHSVLQTATAVTVILAWVGFLATW